MIGQVLAAANPFDPNYGCFPSDFGCLASETLARTAASTIKNMGDFIADMIVNAFGGTDITAQSWQVAGGQFAFWVQVMLPVIVLVLIVQVAIAALLQDWRRMGRSALGAALAVPFSALAVWAMQQISAYTDGVTQAVTSSLQGGRGGTMGDALLNMFGFQQSANNALGQATAVMAHADPITGGVPYQLMMQGYQGDQNVGYYLGAAAMVALMAVASLFLFVAMSIRSFGLLALAALAPVGLMMVGQAKLGAWAQRWISLALGLLLAKPLAAGVLVLAVALAGKTPTVAGVVTYVIAAIAAALSPLWATKLVSFAGAEMAVALHRRASIRDQVSRAQAATAPARGLARLAR